MTEINFGKCIVCLKGGVLTSTPSLEGLLKIKEYANKRVSYGETNFSPLCERISNLTEEEFVKLVYHQDCYKLVVHKQHLQRAESRFKKRSLLPGSVTPLKKRSSIEKYTESMYFKHRVCTSKTNFEGNQL